MKILKCEMCGEVDLRKQDGEYVCQSCRTRYTPEKAKKLLVEGSVSIDRSKDLENFLTLGLRAYEEIEKRDTAAAEAVDYFAKVLEVDPENAIANAHIGILRADEAKSITLAKKSYEKTKMLTLQTQESDEQKAEAVLQLVVLFSDKVLEIPLKAGSIFSNMVQDKVDEVRNANSERDQRAAGQIELLGAIEKLTPVNLPRQVN